MEDDHSLTPDRDKDNDRHRRYLGKTFKSQEESTSDPRLEDGPSSEEGDTLFHAETVYVFKDGAWREISTTQIIWDLALRSSTPEVATSSKSLQTGSRDTTNDLVIDRLYEPQSQMSRHGEGATTSHTVA